MVGVEVRNEKIIHNSSVKLFWNFENEMFGGRRSHQFEFSGQVFPEPANRGNQAKIECQW